MAEASISCRLAWTAMIAEFVVNETVLSFVGGAVVFLKLYSTEKDRYLIRDSAPTQIPYEHTLPTSASNSL